MVNAVIGDKTWATKFQPTPNDGRQGLFQPNNLMASTSESLAIHDNIVDEKNGLLARDRGRMVRQSYALRRIPSLEAAKVNIRQRTCFLSKRNDSRHSIGPSLDASDASQALKINLFSHFNPS